MEKMSRHVGDAEVAVRGFHSLSMASKSVAVRFFPAQLLAAESACPQRLILPSVLSFLLSTLLRLEGSEARRAMYSAGIIPFVIKFRGSFKMRLQS